MSLRRTTRVLGRFGAAFSFELPDVLSEDSGTTSSRRCVPSPSFSADNIARPDVTSPVAGGGRPVFHEAIVATSPSPENRPIIAI